MRAPHRANHAFSTVIYLRPFRPCSFIASFFPFFNVGPASPGAIDILAINKDPTDSPISLIRANNRKESRFFRFATIDRFYVVSCGVGHIIRNRKLKIRRDGFVEKRFLTDLLLFEKILINYVVSLFNCNHAAKCIRRHLLLGGMQLDK